MKLSLVIAGVLLMGTISCGTSVRERKANSPECQAAKREAAERQAKAELLNTEIAARNETNRRKLENLRLDDHIAALHGRPPKNQKAEALLESSIRANDIGLQNAPSMENLSRSIDQTKIQQACEAN